MQNNKIEQIKKHNKSFEAMCWLTHNCNARTIIDLQKRDSKVREVNEYISFLETRIKELERCQQLVG